MSADTTHHISIFCYNSPFLKQIVCATTALCSERLLPWQPNQLTYASKIEIMPKVFLRKRGTIRKFNLIFLLRAQF